VARAGRRHVDHARIATGFFLRLCDCVEHRQVKMRCPAFARRCATDHLGAVGNRRLRMERAILAGEALANNFGVLVDENSHYAAPFTALTIFSAASSRSSPDVTFNPDSLMIFLPRSPLVPSSRTTRGTFSPTSFTAATTPSAITSHFM